LKPFEEFLNFVFHLKAIKRAKIVFNPLRSDWKNPICWLKDQKLIWIREHNFALVVDFSYLCLCSCKDDFSAFLCSTKQKDRKTRKWASSNRFANLFLFIHFFLLKGSMNASNENNEARANNKAEWKMCESLRKLWVASPKAEKFISNRKREQQQQKLFKLQLREIFTHSSLIVIWWWR
jgi:hypothetical protein